ncbi:hypothetical protein [Yimella sp. NH-Cas1]|uniref:hypothetical protein n=1 Tax=Yimella sp. NH-Cas1 TaxID=2917726 RepID=UPI001EFB1253|nr:hypothetical protein [Yimella sp. NH-Cas1]MCG8656474.1 hypothetical protein [Yimella sp. NH-Cas1]
MSIRDPDHQILTTPKQIVAVDVALGERIPPTVLSRVVSYDMVGSFVATPIGMLVFGVLATAVPLKPLLIASGVLYALIALSTLAVHSIRTMERLPEHADEPLLT